MQIIDTEEKESMIVGDLSCDLFNNDTTNLHIRELKFVTNLYQYRQVIDKATRVTSNTKSLIDHFYAIKLENIVTSGVTKITISDHYLIYGIQKFPSLKGNTNIIEYHDFMNFSNEAFLEDVGF